MKRKPIQVSLDQHIWFSSYKKLRGFKNSESAFDELQKLADEHFFDITQKDRYEVRSNTVVGIYIHDTYKDEPVKLNELANKLNGVMDA